MTTTQHQELTVAQPVEPPASVNARAAAFGLCINLAMVAIKLTAGLVGHSYALIADAIESSTDVFASLVVWAGVRITARPADETHPFGYGRAEALTVAVVALMLLGAGFGIAVSAVHEIVTPHHAPAPFTLIVLIAVVVCKEWVFRRVLSVAATTDSTAVEADAWHHRSDALTSAAAAIGILIALIGGPDYAAADDWAALVAAGIIVFNGVRFLRVAIGELMDRRPDPAIAANIEAAARSVPGVLATEKLRIRKVAQRWWIDLHVQADPQLSLQAAHLLSGQVKGAIRAQLTPETDVLIHMEPFVPPAV